MRAMVPVKATEDSERGYRPTPETQAMMTAMYRYNDEPKGAGALITADGLRPSSDGKRCPNPMPGPSAIEIRPIYETADLA